MKASEMARTGKGVTVGMLLGFLFGAVLMVAGSAMARRNAQAGAGGQMGGQNAAAGPSDEQHALLMKLTGTYDRVIKFLGQQGATAQPSSGRCEISAVLGGRFIVEKSHDVVFGRPVDGLRVYGYDDATKQYEMARMYTMSNGITLMKGMSTDGGNTIDFTGEAGNRGNSSMTMHARMKQIDADQFSVVLSTVGADGKEMPFQETDYMRKK
jgi:hypothetical protein